VGATSASATARGQIPYPTRGPVQLVGGSEVESRGFLAAAEVAALLGVARRTVYSWIDEGLIPATRIGRRLLRINIVDLRAFIGQGRVVTGDAWWDSEGSSR
jgi:excisionase family DNA binding protein